MKTFREFILEARKSEQETIDWWGKGRPKASQKVAQLRRDRNPQTMSKSVRKITQITKAINDKDQRHEASKPARTAAQRAQDSGRVHRSQYAQTGVRGRIGPDSPSSVGTVSGNKRRRVTNIKTGQDLGSAEPSDTRVSGRYGTVPGGRGTGVSRSGGQIGR
jgi:hypothetical protein